MTNHSFTPERGENIEDDCAIKLLGLRCFETIIEIESVSRHWVIYGAPADHTLGRLPGESEVRPWPIPRTTGYLLNYLIRENRLKHGVEIGTSLGFSSLFLASALAANEGHLSTCEIFQPKIDLAKRHFAKSGLKNIRLIEGDAREKLKSWSSPIDFLFLDADPGSYNAYLALLSPHMAQGSLLVMDNAIDHSFVTEAFVSEISSRPEWESWTLPIDHGLLVARKR